MADRKTEFYWASIGGADPEPVELVEIDERKAVYTCGCGDPFFLDAPDCPVRLGSEFNASAVGHHNHLWLLSFKGKPQPMERPVLASRREAAEMAKQYKEAHRRPHSWRGPR